MRRSGSWTVGLLVLFARSLPAQAIGQGFELERAGQYDQAAAIYLATLRADPTNLSALLGLERVLPPINRLGELLPAAQRAAAASPSNVALRDRKSTRLNSSHGYISYAVFCLKKKKTARIIHR